VQFEHPRFGSAAGMQYLRAAERLVREAAASKVLR
jgi:hypothetical protein